MKTELIILLRKLAWAVLRKTGGEEKNLLDMSRRSSRIAGKELINEIISGKWINRHLIIFADKNKHYGN